MYEGDPLSDFCVYTRQAGLIFSMFPVYEVKKCDETSEKTILEAGNNTLDLDCSDVFKGTTGGTGSTMDSLDLQILGRVVSFLGDRARGCRRNKSFNSDSPNWISPVKYFPSCFLREECSCTHHLPGSWGYSERILLQRREGGSGSGAELSHCERHHRDKGKSLSV